MTNSEVLDKYPWLHDPGEYSYATEADATWAEGVPEGWQPRFFQLCDFINEQLRAADFPLTDFRALQVKEKFGALRFYWACSAGLPPATRQAISDAVSDAEMETSVLCVKCGAKATLTSTGWINPYCQECAEKYVAAANARFLDSPKLTVGEAFTKMEELH